MKLEWMKQQIWSEEKNQNHEQMKNLSMTMALPGFSEGGGLVATPPPPLNGGLWVLPPEIFFEVYIVVGEV